MARSTSWWRRWFGSSQPKAKQSGRKLRVESLEERNLLATFSVTNTDNSGAGSLRQAIIDANNNPGLDTINFPVVNTVIGGISVRFPKTINVSVNALPQITDSVNILGPVSSTNNPLVEIKSTGVSDTLAAGLRLFGGTSTIQGLRINGFNSGQQSGILVLSNGNTIQGNWLGLNFDGTQIAGNGRSNDTGITVRGDNNLIGGPNAADRNVVARSLQGIVVGTGSGSSDNNTIEGNFIGTDASGAIAAGNIIGVDVIPGAANNTFRRNVISANGDYGVVIQGTTVSETRVVGNKIGVGADGTTALGNGDIGVLVANQSHDNQIGGSVVGEGNIIGNNTRGGVFISRDPTRTSGPFSQAPGVGNRVSNNRIFGSTQSLFVGDPAASPVNDNLDLDTGPNNLQNAPVLVSATKTATSLLNITGNFNSTPNRTFRIEHFGIRNFINGIPQDMEFIGPTNVTTDANGNASFSVTLPSSLQNGHFVVSTATDLLTGDTSNFDGVQVGNTNPAITGDALTALIDEGGLATLSGQLTELNLGDVLALTVDWGDGSRVDTYAPGTDPFAVTHRYRDNGVYDVLFTWTDQTGGGNNRIRQVTVNNVAPILANLEADVHGNSRRVTLEGSIVDPGRDSFTLVVDWGDGNIETINVGRDREFKLRHRYSLHGAYNVQLSVLDDDGGSSSSGLVVNA